MSPTNISEVDLLRLALAEAKLQVAFAERDALLARICHQYNINPESDRIDMSTGAVIRKEV